MFNLSDVELHSINLSACVLSIKITKEFKDKDGKKFDGYLTMVIDQFKTECSLSYKDIFSTVYTFNKIEYIKNHDN